MVNQTATYQTSHSRPERSIQLYEVQANPVALETSTAELGVAVVKDKHSTTCP